MPTKKPLRAVSANERAPRKAEPKTIVQAAETGDYRALLQASLLRVAQAVENPKTPGRDLAALSKRLMDIAREIELHDAREEQEASERGAVSDAKFDSSAI